MFCWSLEAQRSKGYALTGVASLGAVALALEGDVEMQLLVAQVRGRALAPRFLARERY